MQGPPQPEQPCAAPLPQESNEKRNASIKTNLGRFDSLVARYYPAVYNFASGLTDDPREAVLLTYRAFNSIRNQLWLHRDDIVLVRILLKAVVRAGVRGVAIESRTSLLAFLRGLSFPARAEFVNVHLSHLLAPRPTFCFRIDHPLYSLRSRRREDLIRQDALMEVKPLINIGNARISAESVKKVNEITKRLGDDIVKKD